MFSAILLYSDIVMQINYYYYYYYDRFGGFSGSGGRISHFSIDLRCCP